MSLVASEVAFYLLLARGRGGGGGLATKNTTVAVDVDVALHVPEGGRGSSSGRGVVSIKQRAAITSLAAVKGTF